MPEDSTQPLLQADRLTKRFPGVLALDDVSLTLHEGEIVAVIGENGAGKSTLMKILAGVQEPEEGRILLEGNEVRMDSVRTAAMHGIALIHQELNLADNLDVGANMFLGREPLRYGMIDRSSIRTQARAALDRIGLDADPDDRVADMPIGKQQMVEIAKALSADARILIFDEPTSSLSQHETERLYEVIRDLKQNGVSMLYISHRLGEVKALADRVVVLRDGRFAGELGKEEITHDNMVRLMVGRDLSQFYVRTHHEPGDPVLEVRNVKTLAHPDHSVSLTIRSGEIVGIAGLVGAGRTELLETLFGVAPKLEGEVLVDGQPVYIESPEDAIAAGMALVPEDRKQHGVILEMAVGRNLSLASLKRDQNTGFLNRPKEKVVVDEMIDVLSVKTPSDKQMARYLSGGNQQKLVIGKWLALEPRILLLDEPTRGIDVGAKQEIYRLMEELAARNVAVLFVSSEMEEILGMSDRTLVMHEGRITGELQHDQLSEEAVMTLATGGE